MIDPPFFGSFPPASWAYTPAMELSGASALVTGAGRGIGRAVSLALARAGTRVTAVARTVKDLESLAREAGAGRILPFPGDLVDPAVCRAAVQAAVESHGGLQILINNAAVAFQKPLAETTDEQWDGLLALNVSAPFRLTRAALPHLSVKGGQVFMISSLAGSNPIAGMSAYCASKAALDHLASCLMLEVRQSGVKVTTIAPGSVNTGFGGVQGDAPWKLQPEDVAAMILDLLRARDDGHASRIEMRPLRPPRS